MLNKHFISIVFVIFIMSIVQANAAEFTVTETFEPGTYLSLEDSNAPETIQTDTIINTVTDDKSYSAFGLNNGLGRSRVMVKNLKKFEDPSILETGPLGERHGVFHTGKSSMTTLGISKWYHFSGVKFDFDVECETLEIAFSYLNNRTRNTGRVAIVTQQVDADENIIWEDVWIITGYKDYIDGWENIHLLPYRMETRLAGRSFNRVWLVEAELFKDDVENTGGYFDDVMVKVTYPDPIVEEPPAEEPFDPFAGMDEDPPIDEEPPVDDRGGLEPPVEEPGTDITYEEPETDPWDVDAAVADLNALCPSDEDWKNHGEYVSCIAAARNAISDKYEKKTLNKAVTIAAKSNIGKKPKGTNRERGKKKGRNG